MRARRPPTRTAARPARSRSEVSGENTAAEGSGESARGGAHHDGVGPARIMAVCRLPGPAGKSPRPPGSRACRVCPTSGRWRRTWGDFSRRSRKSGRSVAVWTMAPAWGRPADTFVSSPPQRGLEPSAQRAGSPLPALPRTTGVRLGLASSLGGSAEQLATGACGSSGCWHHHRERSTHAQANPRGRPTALPWRWRCFGQHGTALACQK